MSSWEDKWCVIKSGLGGGQGDCFKVSHIDGSSDRFFLKQIKDFKNSERRRRFYIETVIYQSISVEGLPKIVETNAHLFEEKDILLYYVSEFIDGVQLNEHVRLNDLSESENINLFKQLLNILSNCHTHDVIHRDIKPENIVIHNEKLYLVDFGISYFEGTHFDDNITKVGQEIGNRFLRLPEHSAGSIVKREFISDLTMAIGIIFFMLTKTYPRKLVNEKGEYPHQNEEVRKKIEILEYSKIWNLLFDKGFQPKMSSRWNTAAEIFKVIDKMSKKENKLDEIRNILKIHENQIDHTAFHVLQGGLHDVQSNIELALVYILSTEAKGFEHEKQDRIYTQGDWEMKSEIRVFPKGNRKNILLIRIKTRLVGEQVIGFLNINDSDFEIIRIALGSAYESKRLSDQGKRFIRDELENIVLPELIKILD